MRASGGRRITRLACGLFIATLAAACTGDSGKDEAEPAPTEDDVDVSAGGGSAGGASAGGLSLDSSFGAAPTSTGVPGLSVRGEARGKAAADVAFVIVQPPVSGVEGFGESSIKPEDRKAVIEGVAGLGIPTGDVSFASDQRIGQPSVRVKVPVDQLASQGPKIVETVERTFGRSLSAGATFSLSGCDPAATPLRQEAMQQAGNQAKALADVTKVSLGGIVGVSQDAGSGIPEFLVPTTEGCPMVVAGQVEQFDARPEVEISVGVNVTYAIAGAPAPGAASRPLLWTTGSATAKGKADEAYVMVLFESEDEEASGGPSSEDRTRVLDGLAKLKIAGDDVEITTRADYGVTTVVQVETEAADLATKGKDILRAVEDVLGRSDTNGVRFASSTCPAALAKARKDAVADARQRGATLAEAAAVKLGDVHWVSESTPTGADPCDDSIDAALALDDYDSSPLQPFDAEAEFTLTTTAQLAFLIG